MSLDGVLLTLAVLMAFVAGTSFGVGVTAARSAGRERRAYREGIADGLSRAFDHVRRGRARRDTETRTDDPG